MRSALIDNSLALEEVYPWRHIAARVFATLMGLEIAGLVVAVCENAPPAGTARLFDEFWPAFILPSIYVSSLGTAVVLGWLALVRLLPSRWARSAAWIAALVAIFAPAINIGFFAFTHSFASLGWIMAYASIYMQQAPLMHRVALVCGLTVLIALIAAAHRFEFLKQRDSTTCPPSRRDVIVAAGVIAVLVGLDSTAAGRWPMFAGAYDTRAHAITSYLPALGLVFGTDPDPWHLTTVEPSKRPLESLSHVDEYLTSLRGQKREDLPNVLLIMLESVPAMRTGYMGYARDTTPRLDRLAAESVVFDHCYGASNESQHGQTSILSSTWPMRGNGDWFDKITYPRLLVWEVFHALGYHTALISTQNEDWVNMSTFQLSGRLRPDVYLHGPTIPEGPSYETLQKKDAETINRRLLSYVRDRISDGKRWLLMTNYQRTHHPMPLPLGLDPKFKPVGDASDWTHFGRWKREELTIGSNRFDSALAYVDHHVGALLDGLRELGVLDNTIVIIASDHGSGLEAGVYPVSESIKDTYVHVPCMIHYPKLAPRHFRTNVSTIDLVPTVLGVLGVPPSPAWEGSDVLALGEDRCASRAVFTANTCWRNQWLVTRGTRKWVVDLTERSVQAFEREDLWLANPIVPAPQDTRDVIRMFLQVLNDRLLYYRHSDLHHDFLYPVYRSADWEQPP